MDQQHVGGSRTIDPLRVTSTQHCKACNNERRKRRSCEPCHGGGYEETTTQEGLWSIPGVVFLVCGGPSIKSIDPAFWRARGINTVGVNNAGAYARTSAWCFSDGQGKFAAAAYLDGGVATYAPVPKLKRCIRVKRYKEAWGDKDSDGYRARTPATPFRGFHQTTMKVADCPNTWGYMRRTVFDPATFFTTEWAHWGLGGKSGHDREFTKLNTMFCGLRLAHYLGGRTIYLLGSDFTSQEGDYAWNQTGGFRGMGKSVELLTRLKPHAEAAGIRIYNCNPQSHLEAFDHVSLRDAVKHAQCRGILEEPIDLAGWYDKGPKNDERDARNAGKFPELDLKAELDRHPGEPLG